jgi:hypothetical protein
MLSNSFWHGFLSGASLVVDIFVVGRLLSRARTKSKNKQIRVTQLSFSAQPNASSLRDQFFFSRLRINAVSCDLAYLMLSCRFCYGCPEGR